jgi:hypothetical protein
MRTTTLLCSLLLLAGCSPTPSPEPRSGQQPPPGPAPAIRQPPADSPIVVADGTIGINARKFQNVGAHSASFKITNHEAVLFEPWDPSERHPQLKDHDWTLKLYKSASPSDAGLAATLTLNHNADKSRVAISTPPTAPAPLSTKPGPNGTEILVVPDDNVHFLSATFSVDGDTPTEHSCPASGCVMTVHYCPGAKCK